jgi:uroporphyrinogen-III synthase
MGVSLNCRFGPVCPEGYHQLAHVMIFDLTSFSSMTMLLDGVRVATTENRYPEQLARLLEREGAIVYSCPLLRETTVEHSGNARQFMELCETTKVDVIIFYTGVGIEFLFREVNKPEVIARSRIVARGPKAVNALKKFGVQGDFVADAPTTEGILKTLERQDLHGKSVLVQLYGQENVELRNGLEAMGAIVTGISLYHYEQASNEEAVSELVRRITHGEIDAITFTNGPQARFLLKSAASMGSEGDVLKHFKRDIAVVSIGEITSRALREMGIEPHVIPEEPKMGPMVKALADFFESKST